jgi:hypothetical protein
MQNYFNYFTEIEEHFSRRRGSLLLLSTLDWALIESWREAGVPLAAALRGIDAAFDKYEARRSKSPGRQSRKINGLAWCAQAVMAAAEEMRARTTKRLPGLQNGWMSWHPTYATARLSSKSLSAIWRCWRKSCSRLC